MMTQVTVDAPAKLNLTLNVEGRRADGYHLLSSVFQSISLSDRVTVSKTGGSALTLTTSDPLLPTDEKNLAHRAAQAFCEATCLPLDGMAIHIEKQIPQQAGLGGGSADAAAVLVGLNALLEADIPMDTLCEIGEKIGADVPFCLVGGTAMVRGIGEVIEPLPALPDCHIVVAKPPCGVSTVQAYRLVDAVKTVPADQDAICLAIESGDLPGVGQLLCNVFEQAVSLPEVETLKEKMAGFDPLGCAMSGSGSAVFALFDNAAQAKTCAHSLMAFAQTYVCRPLPRGAAAVSRKE